MGREEPIVETAQVASPEVASKLEALGFTMYEDDLHAITLGTLARRNAAASAIARILGENGVDAAIRDCTAETPCSFCRWEQEHADDGEEDDDEEEEEGGDDGEEEDLEEFILVNRRLLNVLWEKFERLQEHIEFLEGRTVWLAGSQHPDAASRILVRESPQTLPHESRDVYVDLIRKHPVPATPEEEVRQRVLRHLMDYLGFPSATLASEWPLKRKFKDTSDRADIVVMWRTDEGDDEESDFECAAIIECKRPGIPLNDEVWDQVARYAARLNPRVIAVTDGDQLLTRVASKSGGYVPAGGFPTFQAVRAGRVPPRAFERPRGVARPAFEEIASGDARDAYYGPHSSVADELPLEEAIPCLNLASLLYDEEDVPDPSELGGGWYLEQDRGLLDVNFGNAGFKSHAYEGYYRGFVLKAPGGNAVLPFLKVHSALYGGAVPTPILALGFHHLDKGKRNHALQLNLRKGLVEDDEGFVLVHNGRLGLGEGGAIAGAKTRAFMEKHEPDLVQAGRIVLGRLPKDRLVGWSDFLPILGSMVRYARACERLRATVRVQ